MKDARIPSLVWIYSIAFTLLTLTTLSPISALAQTSPAPSTEISSLPPAPGERALVAKLMPPCCSAQTLDVHTSEAARELRLEIRRRLYAGESPDAIEQSLVLRYGERIRAVPAKDPMRMLAPIGLLLAGVAGFLVLRMLKHWQARAAAIPTPMSSPEPADGIYDQRLDDELKDLD